MGSTSDSILVLPHIKLNKNQNDGELHFMSEKLSWRVANQKSNSVSHKYCDIKTQKLSAVGKDKVQLQVCLHDGTVTTFQFVNPGGSADQMADQDKVKELLMQIFKEMKEKKRLLAKHPQLAQLYMGLVQSEVLSDKEFWTDHATLFFKKLAESRNTQQDVGVSASFLTDLKPVPNDGYNTRVRYNVTGEFMANVFRTYPSVKQKHLQCVPAKMTEEEFWEKFFQSHYFHRDIMDPKGFFADCGKQDEQVVTKDLEANINDPLLNLTALHDVEDEDDESTTNSSSSKPPMTANQNMIRRLNHHSILVLKALEQLPTLEPDASAAVMKRARLQEANYYDDLESKETDSAVQLHLSRIERYRSGPTAAMQLQTGMDGNGSAAVSGGELSPEEFQSVVTRWMRGVPDGGYNPAGVLSSATTLADMADLTVGRSLMSAPNSATHLPVELLKELKHLYLSLNEILRHFWAAFPPSTPELVEKVTRKIAALDRFKLIILSLFEQKLTQACSTTEADNVLRPLKFQMDAATRRYTQWKYRQPVSGKSTIS